MFRDADRQSGSGKTAILFQLALSPRKSIANYLSALVSMVLKRASGLPGHLFGAVAVSLGCSALSLEQGGDGVALIQGEIERYQKSATGHAHHKLQELTSA